MHPGTCLERLARHLLRPKRLEPAMSIRHVLVGGLLSDDLLYFVFKLGSYEVVLSSGRL